MFPCSHGNISFLQNEKELRKSKDSYLHKGRFLYSYILLRFRNTLPLTPLGATPSGECTHTGASPTTKSRSLSQNLISWGSENKLKVSESKFNILGLNVAT
jgi:hypothetical protein